MIPIAETMRGRVVWARRPSATGQSGVVPPMLMLSLGLVTGTFVR